MILKNTFNWDCCAFPKPLNAETIAIISSKGNAWCDVQLNGLQGKSAHYLRWHRTALQQERKNPNVLICLDFDAVEPMAELINPVVMYYLCKSLRNSPCGEVDAECRTSLWQMRTVNFFFRGINSFHPMRIFLLRGSGPIIHCTIIDVGINYITAIRQADWCLLHKQRISIREWGASSFVWWQYVEWLAF